MRTRTGSVRFCVLTLLQTHKCKVVFIAWPLHQRHMTITVRTVPEKNGDSFEDHLISCHSVELTLDIHSRGPIHSQEPWFGRLSSQPSLPHWISVCAREHWLIYRHTKNVYIAWLQVRIHFELDWNHLLEWIGTKPVWIQFGLIHFWCERHECTLNRTECARSVQCEQAFKLVTDSYTRPNYGHMIAYLPFTGTHDRLTSCASINERDYLLITSFLVIIHFWSRSNPPTRGGLARS